MTKTNNPEDVVTVSNVPNRRGVTTGKPKKVMTASRSKVAFPTAGSTSSGSGGNFYSPELSTDFLELPQSIDEQRNFYRFFYDYDPFVGQAIDLHTELPLSKLRIGMPDARSRELAERSMRFCTKWSKSVKLLQRLMEITHELNLIGEANVFAEDTNPDMPRSVREQMIRELTDDGQFIERWDEYDDANDRAVKWLNKNYKGWTDIRCLPPEQVRVESFPFTREMLVELVIDSKTKAIVNQASNGDERAIKIVNSMPPEIIEAVMEGRNVPLNTDPEAGSFVYVLSRKRSSYDQRGKSILGRCLRALVFRDKVRQSLTSIASRHMTPYRLVYGLDMSDDQTEALRDQVDLALQDPDYSIITNFEVNWQEMGADQRLPDWSWVFELTDRQLYAGLGVTESLLSGESSYSGDRIHLEVINTRFMLLRELLQDLVEEQFFKPMCARMGFVEEDEDGNMVVIVPKLTFTRLALRDTQDTYDALFNMYQKGSIPVEVILDLLNIDPIAAHDGLKKDFGTLNDATMNEVLRSAYSKVGDNLVEGTELTKKIAENLGLVYKKPDNTEGRF